MVSDTKNIVNLDLEKEKKILNFSDFQKQNLKFDILKLQEAYKQIIQTKKFDDGGGISHFGAICLTRKPGDPESVKGSKARGIYWTKPDKSGEEVSRDIDIDESEYSEFIFRKTYSIIWLFLPLFQQESLGILVNSDQEREIFPGKKRVKYNTMDTVPVPGTVWPLQ